MWIKDEEALKRDSGLDVAMLNLASFEYIDLTKDGIIRLYRGGQHGDNRRRYIYPGPFADKVLAAVQLMAKQSQVALDTAEADAQRQAKANAKEDRRFFGL